MKYYLGVDGGGSKTEALVLDENAVVIGVGRAGPGNYEVHGIESAKKCWLESIEQAKSGRDDIRFEKACFGLGGADFPEDYEMYNKEISSLNIAPEFVLENDAVIALRAGSSDYWGILIIMGSGSNGFGKAKDGKTFRYYGEGYEFGDWGGSYSATQDLLHNIFRSYDGRGEKTVLEERILDFFKVKNHDELAKLLYYHPEEKIRAQDFATSIFKAIEEEDNIAVKIGEKIINEAIISIKGLMKRLDIMKENTPVVLAGSFFKGAPWIAENISARTHMFAPNAEVILLEVPPVVGAALIAWESNERLMTEDIWKRMSKISIKKK